MPVLLRHCWAACALALLLTAAPALRAQDIAPPPDRTCATPEPTAAEAREASEAVRAWLAQHPAPREGEVVTIPIAFHVIYSGGAGNVPEQWVTDQVEVLNDAFLPLGYRFVLAIVDRTENADWFFGLVPGTQETQMKQALAIEPARFLNIYTAQLGQSLLGWAYFPNSFGENVFLHGVVLHYNTLPGGTFFPYNEGDTGTHEVGHYVGLYHTFEGGCAGGDTPPGCETGGDQVCDTAAEANPAFGCPVGRNSCPTGGPDPVTNFMDYTDDACMDHFTDGQAVRALALMSQYRPTIMSNPAAFASPSELDFADVGVGASDTRTAVVVNLSDAPLVIESISTDNDVFVPAVASLTVPPLSAAEVEVTFTPNDEEDETGTLTMETTNPDVGTLTVALDGTGVALVAALGLDRNGLLAEAPAGGSTTETLTISNAGTLALEYDFVSVPSWIPEIVPDPGTVEPGEEVDVELTLSAAGLGEGVYQDLLGLRTNDPFLDPLALHVVFAVDGAFAPPALLAPRYEADDVPTDYTLAWTTVPGAELYEVQVSPDDAFEIIVASGTFDVTTASFAADAGETFFWRVRSLGAGGDESEWTLPFTFTTTAVTAAEPDAEPERSALGAIFPNPTRGATTVPFSLDAPGPVTLQVFDVTGRLVATLATERAYAAGAHAVHWDAEALPAGVYLVRLAAGEEAAAQRVVVLR